MTSKFKEFRIPGMTREEFVEKYGKEALAQVPLSRIISWAGVVYILHTKEGIQ